ncbi:hypothetical protein D3C73_1068590 [compost metagenome]
MIARDPETIAVVVRTHLAQRLHQHMVLVQPLDHHFRGSLVLDQTRAVVAVAERGNQRVAQRFAAAQGAVFRAWRRQRRAHDHRPGARSRHARFGTRAMPYQGAGRAHAPLCFVHFQQYGGGTTIGNRPARAPAVDHLDAGLAGQGGEQGFNLRWSQRHCFVCPGVLHSAQITAVHLQAHRTFRHCTFAILTDPQPRLHCSAGTTGTFQHQAQQAVCILRAIAGRTAGAAVVAGQEPVVVHELDTGFQRRVSGVGGKW